MELTTKADWREAEERTQAWWQREVIDRPVLQVRAPRKGVTPAQLEAVSRPVDVPPDQMQDWFTNVERVVERCGRVAEMTFWGGEAFPVVFPVSIQLVAIPAAYLGCPYTIDPYGNSAWAEPIIEDWATRPKLQFNPENEWWQLSRKLLGTAAQESAGRYYVSVPDLNAPGEIVVLMRDTQRILYDLMDNPEPIKEAIAEANVAWYRFWQAAVGTIHQWIDGYFYWMGIWSDSPSVDLQCDFNVMISPPMFDEFFLPALEQQTRWIERTIFHLDGPEAIRHLDSLLALPRMSGIQWVQASSGCRATASRP
jgi:5-methyltetrahydrofolate--homocysteine methyltransferase